MIACPPTPEWKRPDDLDLNGEAKQDDDDDNGDIEPPNVCILFSPKFLKNFRFYFQVYGIPNRVKYFLCS